MSELYNKQPNLITRLGAMRTSLCQWRSGTRPYLKGSRLIDKFALLQEERISCRIWLKKRQKLTFLMPLTKT